MRGSYSLQGTFKVQVYLYECLKALLFVHHSFYSIFNRFEWMLWQFERLSTWYIDLDKNVSSHLILNCCLMLLVCLGFGFFLNIFPVSFMFSSQCKLTLYQAFQKHICNLPFR